jgi:alpha-glucan,water dikinase
MTTAENLHVENDKPAGSLVEALRRHGGRENLYEREYTLPDGKHIAVAVSRNESGYDISIISDVSGPLLMHWGIARSFRSEWELPPASMHPEGTTLFQEKAAQTPFEEIEGLRRLDLKINNAEAPMGISFVLKDAETGHWLKDGDRNFFIPVSVPETAPQLEGAELASIAEEIIGREMGNNSWTLMHRFNLCYELLDRAKKNNIDALALIFVWLRFSFTRQLDWQRNYNTKPAELGHAMDRLTLKLAGRYSEEPGEREIIRLIMTTLGRGSDAQRVRDEVLNIMHRHHIKEISGHFMEEWHQKLHNNATPDDIVICEAYLEFLRSNGNLDLFYKKLTEGGVSKERLESYERPIRSHPDFIPDLKEALMLDFDNFLGILKSVHSGTDLGSAIHASRHLFDPDMQSLMDFIWSHCNDRALPLTTVVEKITEARRRLAKQLTGYQDAVRDLLFLDLALEDFVRSAIEKNLGANLEADQLVELVSMVIENLSLSSADPEISYCFYHWARLAGIEHIDRVGRLEREWSLHAKAVADRLARVLGSFSDRFYRLIQPKAEFLGKAFHAAPWTIAIFSEEVLRGRPAFALSALLRRLGPILRKNAELGVWQIISPGRGKGRVELSETLKSIQGRRFDEPVIIVTEKVSGDEEIPGGVAAIITPSEIDILSHLAVRARNSRILFATCYDADMVGKLQSLGTQITALGVNASGEVIFEEQEAAGTALPRFSAPHAHVSPPAFKAYAILPEDFDQTNVGSKSNNLKKMQGRLLEWIGIPASAALPFGVLEKVLSEEINREIAGRYHEITVRIDAVDENDRAEALDEIRKTVTSLLSPDDLPSSVQGVMMKAGLDAPSDWEDAWTCIKKVWASKWNERAYLSRRARGIRHNDLLMAVLIQRVVEADYSYVIHTVNPFTGNKDELYAEVVLGLGEALVGNYPGRALSFVCKKRTKEPKLFSFPSKSAGLFGSGFIFRSDSNGEDLAGFAGAGLYDSFILPPARISVLDYSGDPLLWDSKFRVEFMGSIAEIGIKVEAAMGSAQDIEGAHSKGRFSVVQSRPQVGIDV